MKYLVGTAVMASALASAYASPLAVEEEAGSPLVNNALQFLARASSTSEVLTLNLVSLGILLLLKLGVFVFSFFTLSGSTARSADSGAALVTEADLNGGMCFMMYTAGDYEKLECIKRTACEEPQVAKNYITAATMWKNMHKAVGFVPFNPKYLEVMDAVEDAINHSANGGDCAVYPW